MATRTKKQLSIPGAERKTIGEIDAAAEAYVSARDERMKLTEQEVASRDALIQVMKKHKVDVYRADASPPLVVTLIPGEDKVKVTRADDDEAQEDAA